MATTAELILSQQEGKYPKKNIIQKQRALDLEIERGKLMVARNKLKLAQLKWQLQSSFSLEPKTLNLDFRKQFPKSSPNLEKRPFKIKSYDDNILNYPVLKENSKSTSHYPSVYQNSPLDNRKWNLKLPLKPESHIDSSYSEKTSTESHHNKNETAKGIGKTLAVDNETSSSIKPGD